jgi:hypothetical protein
MQVVANFYFFYRNRLQSEIGVTKRKTAVLRLKLISFVVGNNKDIKN